MFGAGHVKKKTLGVALAAGQTGSYLSYKVAKQPILTPRVDNSPSATGTAARGLPARAQTLPKQAGEQKKKQNKTKKKKEKQKHPPSSVISELAAPF